VEQTYPSGRVVKNVLDNKGDLEMVQSKKISAAGYWNYARNFTYNPAGAVTSMQLGNGRWESTQFNSRLQPTQIALGTTPNATNLLKLDYTYGTTQNNGNVLSQTITVPTVGQNSGFVATQAYAYDSLNRLKSAEETISGQTSWKQTFTFDRYGNRRFDESNTTTLPKDCIEAGHPAVCEAMRPIVNPSVNAANNRLNGYAFDAAGNTTVDVEGRTFIYDAENKQVKVETIDHNGNTVATVGEYEYDGDGKRVKKYVPSTGDVRIFVYDASGKLIGEYSTITADPQDAKTSYLTTDHLGSPRVLTGQLGEVISRRDFHPFGEEIATAERTAALGYQPDALRQKFTGYVRDAETGLEFAEARYLASGMGRFLSPDPLPGKKNAPQTWNPYAYVENNPLNLVDPLGTTGVPANVNSFVYRTLRYILGLALRLNVSAGALMAISGYETGWGSSYAFRKYNNPSGASIKEVPIRYQSLADGYADW
jgi:RHS repeat-associated protein